MTKRRNKLKPRKTGKSAKSNARRTRRTELDEGNVTNNDGLSVSAFARSSGSLMNKGNGNETSDMNDGGEKSARDIGIGNNGIAIAVAAEQEIGIGARIAIATVLVTVPRVIVLNEPRQGPVNQREIEHQRLRTPHLRHRSHPWMRKPSKKLLYKCYSEKAKSLPQKPGKSLNLTLRKQRRLRTA